MRAISYLIVAIIVNTVALVGIAAFIDGVTITGNLTTLFQVGVVLTVLNLVLKPVLKLLLGPVIVLTLGLGLIAVNGILLYILDIIFDAVTIQGIVPLIYAAVVFGFVNLIFHSATKKK